MKKAGVPQFDYNTFKETYDSNPQLQKLVKFDPQGVTINDSSMDQVGSTEPSNADTVGAMAKRAPNLSDL
jgi:hypothetical protein